MKELLTFLSAKTASVIGRKPAIPQDPGNRSRVTQVPLDLLTDGYSSIGDEVPTRFVAALEGLTMTERVVMFQGAFTAAACLDACRPLEFSRSAELVNLSPAHIGGLGLGIGHALSALNVDVDITPELADHYLGWLAMDAYGMHEGYFNWFDGLYKMRIPSHLPPLAQEAFDQGIGRAIFFVAGSDAGTICDLIERFPRARTFSMWRGIGLMIGFWGAEDERHIKRLYKQSGAARPFFQQGIAQAVSMRVDMDEVEDHNQAAAEIACGASAPAVAELAQIVLNISSDNSIGSASFLRWQNKLVEFFSTGVIGDDLAV